MGALSDDARALVDDAAPNAQAVDRLAQETVDVVTSTHGSILRAVVDRFRAIVAQVTATPLLGTGTRRQAVQDAMRRFADEGIRSFTDRAAAVGSSPALSRWPYGRPSRAPRPKRTCGPCRRLASTW